MGARSENEAKGFTASMTELRSALQLNPSTTTGIVQRLEKAGYIARLPKSEDRRKNMIILTDKGANIIRRHPSILHEELLSKLDRMGDEAYGELKQSFLHIIDFLDIQSMDAAPIVAPGAEFDPTQTKENSSN